MNNLISNFSFDKSRGNTIREKQKNEEDIQKIKRNKEITSIIYAIENVKRELEIVQSIFNNSSDPDILEYAIYEEYALKLKYSYLVKNAKKNNIKYCEIQI